VDQKINNLAENKSNMKRETNPEGASAIRRLMTHTGLGILVSAGIDQQPHAISVTIPGGIYQRRPSALQVKCTAKKHSAAAIATNAR
jgi:hypothetical protein